MMYDHEKSDSAIGGAIRCGVDGAKGGDQEERERAKHAPDTEPGARVTGARARTASSNACPLDTRGGSRMPELGLYGSVRGAAGNSRPYREHGFAGDQ
jgi:hypothetical protein